MSTNTDVVPVELSSVAETLANGEGFWRSCSGCHETEDGHPMGDYPYSEILKCDLGSGCSECGGIGAVWDDTDYGAMADAWDAAEIAREQVAELQPPIYQVMVGDKWVDSTAAEYVAVSNEKCIVYAAIVAPTAEKVEALPATDLIKFKQTAQDFEDFGETETDYAMLLDWAARGLLECDHFRLTKRGRELIAAVASSAGDQS